MVRPSVLSNSFFYERGRRPFVLRVTFTSTCLPPCMDLVWLSMPLVTMLGESALPYTSYIFSNFYITRVMFGRRPRPSAFLPFSYHHCSCGARICFSSCHSLPYFLFFSRLCGPTLGEFAPVHPRPRRSILPFYLPHTLFTRACGLDVTSLGSSVLGSPSPF